MLPTNVTADPPPSDGSASVPTAGGTPAASMTAACWDEQPKTAATRTFRASPAESADALERWRERVCLRAIDDEYYAWSIFETAERTTGVALRSKRLRA